MNLKESMQADEKLECDYNDDKQLLLEDGLLPSIHKSKLINLEHNNDPMSMSFHEGRGELFASSNSDELNKVQVLPEDEDKAETSQIEVENVTAVENVQTLVDIPQESLIDEHSSPLPAETQLINTTNTILYDDQTMNSATKTACHIVNEVTDLVNKMDLENGTMDIEAESKVELVDVTSESTSEEKVLIENEIPLLSEVPSNIPNVCENIADNLDFDDKPLVVLETVQQEVTAENEFITDESVLNVQSPVSFLKSTETEKSDIIESSVDNDSVNSQDVVPVLEKQEPKIAQLEYPNPIPTEVIVPPTHPNIETKQKNTTTAAKQQVKPRLSTLKSTTKQTPGATKLTETSTMDKKPTAIEKPLLKATTKSVASNPLKKPTMSRPLASNTKPATKPPLTTTTKPSLTANVKAKPPVEKKVPSTITKKPLSAPTNGDIVPIKRPIANTKPTTTKVTSTSSLSTNKTTTMSNTATKSSSATLKPSIPSKQSSVAARPSSTSSTSTVTSSKPGLTPASTGRTSAPPSTTAASVTQRSKVALTSEKRKTTVPRTVGATSTKAAPVSSRLTTTQKDAGSVTAIRNSLNKTKTAPKSETKLAPVNKTISSDYTNGSLNNVDNGSLQVEKEKKNEGNHLLTSNGAINQNIVIDSAAD
ncbi:microtubule-associated protein 4-like [Uranotaenia lowii]|uniref:microtubule-associated protein 4-like n=1 Tax=Uranotaenia lowii TaxID=190385 RepID=UPI00247AFC5B|nr:microtubule-associated protein 4-like [Uranotaenia lowii]